MTSIEAYLVATLFTAVAGYACGNGVRTLELANNQELGKKSSTLLQLLGLASIPVAFVYAVRWGFITDGPHLTWVPVLLAYLFAFAGGKKSADRNRNALMPWRLPLVGTLIVVVGFHLIGQHIAS